jgi:hypothetical protein
LPFQSFNRLDMTENRIFTLCRMITWVVFLRMFYICPTYFHNQNITDCYD